MRRINSSTVSLALSGVALFVALGGTAVAVSGQIGTGQIKNSAVTNHKIANGAVGNHKLSTGAVGNQKLANGSVSNAKLRNGSVSASKLAAGAVSGASLGAGSVGATNLGAGSVLTNILGDASVTNSKLADNSVSTSKLQDNAVTNSKLANNSVSTTKLQDNSVSTTKLQDNSVTNSKLGPDAVTTDKVRDGSLTASDVAPGTFVQGNGLLGSSRNIVPVGFNQEVASLGFADIEGNCATGAKPFFTIVPLVNHPNLFATITTFGGPATVTIDTENAINAGTQFPEPNPTGVPQTIDWQVAYQDGGGTNHVAHVVTSGQSFGGSCLFIGQGTTTG